MLTGSMAMIYYAQPRMTRDIDLVVEIFPELIGRMEHIFKNEYYLSIESIKDAIDNEFMFNLIHINSSVKIDCIVRKNQEYRLVEFERRNKIKEAFEKPTYRWAKQNTFFVYFKFCKCYFQKINF